MRRPASRTAAPNLGAKAVPRSNTLALCASARLTQAVSQGDERNRARPTNSRLDSSGAQPSGCRSVINEAGAEIFADVASLIGILQPEGCAPGGSAERHPKKRSKDPKPACPTRGPRP